MAFLCVNYLRISLELSIHLKRISFGMEKTDFYGLLQTINSKKSRAEWHHALDISGALIKFSWLFFSFGSNDLCINIA